jgi:hypothetical protein
MKSVMFCAGLPRFGEFFHESLKKIKSDDIIDLYFYMWESNIDYRNILCKIPDNFRIKSFIQVTEPKREEIVPRPSENDNIDRVIVSCLKQHYGLKKVFDSIEYINEQYSRYIRFRVDGIVDREIRINEFDVNEGTYIPQNDQYTFTDNIPAFNDQFAIGNYSDMKNYCSLFDHLDHLFYNGLVPIHPENALRFFLDSRGVNIITAKFEHYLERKKI